MAPQAYLPPQGSGRADAPAPGVRRLIAPNPGPMTERGTNSYLVGQGELALIDPGPDDPDHLAALLAALQPGERITAILVTHPHLDHSAGAAAASAATGAPVLGFGPAGSGLSATMARLAASGLTGGGEGIDHDFLPDRRLSDGERLEFGVTPLEVIHTPGHMASHVAFAWGDILFSGDLAMGWASSLISPPEGDMAAYMASLAQLRQRAWRLLLPGHGAPVTDPAARLAALVAHRLQREGEVLAALAAAPATPADLACRIYRDTPAVLMPAAERNVLAHLIDLTERALVAASPGPGATARYRLP